MNLHLKQNLKSNVDIKYLYHEVGLRDIFI